LASLALEYRRNVVGCQAHVPFEFNNDLHDSSTEEHNRGEVRPNYVFGGLSEQYEDECDSGDSDID